MTNRIKRRHHYTPRFYLAHFADARGALQVLLRRDGKRIKSSPEKIGFEKDFYRLSEPLDEGRPDALEDALAAFEAEAAPVIREIVRGRKLPTSEDALSILYNLIAFQSVRVPTTRAMTTGARQRTHEIIADLLVSSPEMFESHCRQAGIDTSAVTYESMKSFVRAGFRTVVPTEIIMDDAMAMMDAMLKYIPLRHWSLFWTERPSELFITSDHPVALAWADGRPNGFHPPGHAHLKTNLTFPLSSNVALLGSFEPPAVVAEASRETVAAINAASVMYCARFVASAETSFVCTTASGIVDGDVLAQHFADHPTETTAL
jgi:hypothetical protein